MLMQNSHSSESVLQGLVPPPKPSKDKKPNAPPLPPKKKTYSIDERDALQLSPRLDLRFVSRNDSNNFDVDGDLEYNERGESFSSIEKSLIGATSVNATELSKAMISSQMQDFNDSSFSSTSIDLKVCKIKISQESNSRVFHSTSSDVREMNNCFNFTAINQSDLIADQTRSDESFCNSNLLEEQPPPLPIKTRSRSLRKEHHKSVYDNVEDMNRSSLDTKASTTSSNSSLTSTLSARTENASDFLKVTFDDCVDTATVTL